jgi:transcriptional regulator with XRE-family HTH domain
MLKTIGARIQEIRKKMGLTQEQLSEQVNISPHYLSALERGVYNIKLTLLVDILNVLNCSADEIFQDVVDRSSEVKTNRLSKELEALPLEEQRKILAVVDTMIAGAKK